MSFFDALIIPQSCCLYLVSDLLQSGLFSFQNIGPESGEEGQGRGGSGGRLSEAALSSRCRTHPVPGATERPSRQRSRLHLRPCPALRPRAGPAAWPRPGPPREWLLRAPVPGTSRSRVRRTERGMRGLRTWDLLSAPELRAEICRGFARESDTAAPVANLSKAHSKAKTARVCDTGKKPF